MIYTITFNPSIDYIVKVDDFQLGAVNRVSHEYLLTGGKGINVSIVLSHLGIKSTALGFIAGFTGQEIEKRMQENDNIQTDFIDVQNGYSRINLKMSSHEESEINGNGPFIGTEHIEKLFEKLDMLTSDDLLVLSGSIPQSVSQQIYAEIMERLQSKGIQIVVDASGDLLMNVLSHHPFLIKPNHHELAEMFHVKLSNQDDIIQYAKKLQEMGAKNVLISMAGDGALLISDDHKVYFGAAPQGKVKNSVGAGDSMVAGFIAGYLKNHDYKEAFQTGISSGSASAFSDNLATQKEVDELYQKVQIKELS